MLSGAVQESFNYQDFRIKVAFINGVVVRQKYVRTQLQNGSLSMSDAEIQEILEAEKASADWKLASAVQKAGGGLAALLIKPLLGTVWERSDNQATASMDSSRQSILLDTPAAQNAEAAFAKAAKEGQRQNVPKF